MSEFEIEQLQRAIIVGHILQAGIEGLLKKSKSKDDPDGAPRVPLSDPGFRANMATNAVLLANDCVTEMRKTVQVTMKEAA